MRMKQQFEKHKEVSGSSGNKSELERYLVEDIEQDSDDFDILMWWKFNEPKSPILAEMLRDVLTFPFQVSHQNVHSTHEVVFLIHLGVH